MTLDLIVRWGDMQWGGHGNMGVQDVHGSQSNSTQSGAVIKKEFRARAQDLAVQVVDVFQFLDVIHLNCILVVANLGDQSAAYIPVEDKANFWLD